MISNKLQHRKLLNGFREKIVLSALAAMTLGTVSANAVVLYQDANGQVFTSAAEGRTLIKDKSTSWYSHADKLKFSALAYLGYKYNEHKKDTTAVDYKDSTSQFEVRRAYFQVKAYLLEDPKSYYRVTFDMHQDTKSDDSGTDGDMVLRAKYAYLYLNDVLPFTGVEVGLAHRPWHDYEEHNAWCFRDISKVLLEQKNGANLSNSADFGFNFKTKTQYIDTEIGIFNGEGYHSTQNTPLGMSLEWRATAHLLGVNGKDKQNSKTYFDISFFGQYNQEHKTVTVGSVTENQDLVFGGLHTVYNQPEFLLSAQYIESQDTSNIANNVSEQSGSGYSMNGEYRLGSDKEYRVLARYDSWTPKSRAENRTAIGGIAWDQNKNVQWVANVELTRNKSDSSREEFNGEAYMITAQVEF